MAGFIGDLKHFSAVQLLNLVHLARQTGSLYVDTGAGRIRLSFVDGCLVYARPETERPDLGEILLGAGRLELQHRRRIREQLAATAETEVGLDLVMEGVLSRQAVLDCIAEYSTHLVRQLFTRDEGKFEFRIGEQPPAGKILIHLPLDDLVPQGFSSLTEQELLEKEIPDLNVVPVFIEQLNGIEPQISMNRQEWQLISNMHSRQTLAEIARAANLNASEIRRAVSRLRQAGIVQILQNSDMISAQESPQPLEERKSRESKKGKFSFPFLHKDKPK